MIQSFHKQKAHSFILKNLMLNVFNQCVSDFLFQNDSIIIVH